MTALTTFIKATRPRTFPLALASIICGNGLAWSQLGGYQLKQWLVFALTLWVALALQILSNLANDYGDGVKGTDRMRSASSPERMLASGQFSASQFKTLILAWAALTFFSGVALIAIGFDDLTDFLLFLAFGILAIIAAMAYTMGKRPYGYRAMGEVAVLIFFGWLGVLGSAYLQTHQLNLSHLLPATGCGGLATCVLYVNNMRDIYTDKQAGKITLAVLLGEHHMQVGYYLLLATSLTAYICYAYFYTLNSFLWFIMLPVIFKHLISIYASTQPNLDNPNQINTDKIGGELKRIVLITLTVNLLFVIGLILPPII